jgi:excisionase family DNA binding protein
MNPPISASLTEPNDPNECLSPKAWADKYDLHPNTVYNWVKEGRLPAVRVGARLIRIRRADIEALFTPYQNGEFGIWHGQVGSN